MNTLLSYTVTNPLVLIALAFVLGIYVSFTCRQSGKCSLTMLSALVFIPALVASALLAVNGSLGTSIAILGVFGLVRFRSEPGTAKDIVNVFYAMVTGLLCSTGYALIAIVITAALGVLLIATSKVIFGGKTENYALKFLVPEDMNFEDVFEGILNKYCEFHEVQRIRTIEMGTIFELSYDVRLRESAQIKEFMDEIRAHNGNLNVVYSKVKMEDTLL